MTSVLVDAPARLHLGMLDVSGSAARRYGGLGVGITGYGARVRATAAAACTAAGPDADRALAVAQRCVAALELPGGAHVEVLQAIPAHIGLGSGTKLGLSVARAVAELYDGPTDAPALAVAAGRGARSAVGLWTFALGGLVVEGGVREDGRLSPLIARLQIPPQWRCIVAIPDAPPALSGPAEVAAFRSLAAAGERVEDTIAHEVLTALLPALVEDDVEGFGAALTRVQRTVGAAFAPAQGGVFHPRSAPVVAALEELGAAGVGQSSWGPTVYGVVGSPEQAEPIAQGLRDRFGAAVAVSVQRFAGVGARVRRQ